MRQNSKNLRVRRICLGLMMSAATVGGFAGQAILAPGHAAGCADDLAACYPERHKCSTNAGQNQYPEYSAALNRMLSLPDEDVADPVFIPHRGVWGALGAEGPAENTIAALRKASHQSYRIVEVDAMLSQRIPAGNGYYTGAQVKMSHYFDMYAYGGDAGDNPRDQANLSNFRMRKRNGALSGRAGDAIASITDAIIYARAMRCSQPLVHIFSGGRIGTGAL